MKSEPDVWSIDQQKKAGIKGAPWDGVRNYQAAKNLKAMKKRDQCFFYHSVNEKSIVGIVEVHKEHYPDPTDKSKKFVAIDVKAVKKSSPEDHLHYPPLLKYQILQSQNSLTLCSL